MEQKKVTQGYIEAVCYESKGNNDCLCTNQQTIYVEESNESKKVKTVRA